MNKGLLYVASAAALAGTLGTLGTILNDAGLTGIQIGTMRVVITASILCMIYPIVFKGSFVVIGKNLPILISHAILGALCFNLFFFATTEYLGVTTAVALLYTGPIGVLILSRIFLKDQASLLQWALVLTSVIGVALIIGATDQTQNLSYIGLFCGFMSSIGYAVYVVIGKVALKRVKTSTLLLSSFILSLPLVLLLPMTWQGFNHILTHINLEIITALLAICLLGTILVSFLFINGLGHIAPATAAVVMTLEPVVAILLAVFIVDEILTPIRYLGMALIVASAMFMGILETQQKKAGL